MRIFILSPLAALTIAFTSISPAFGGDLSPQPSPDRAQLETYVDGLMATQLQRYHVAGAALAIVQDGHVVLSKGYGYGDIGKRIPVDAARTQFRIASVTKMFTATAVLQQVERGRLSLCSDIGQYLDFGVPRYSRTPVTLDHLLTHTAGFEEGVFGMFPRPGDQKPLREILKHNLPSLVREPGTEVSYSNHGVGLAGYIVSRVASKSYPDYVQSEIFGPLGMTHSTAEEPVREMPGALMSKGYAFRAGEFRQQPEEYVNVLPAGAITSTVDDMARFMLANLQGGALDGARILRPETVRLMQTCHFRSDPRSTCMAYGLYESRYNGMRAVEHGGDISAFHSQLVLIPAKNFGLFVVYNTVDSDAARDIFAKQIITFLYGRGPRALDYYGSDTATDYAGDYLMNRRPFSNMFKFLGLGLVLQAEAVGVHEIALGDGRWRQVGPGEFENEDPLQDDSRLIFRRDTQGRAVGALSTHDPIAESRKVGLIDSPLLAAVAGLGWFLSGGVLATCSSFARDALRAADALSRGIVLVQVSSFILALVAAGALIGRIVAPRGGPYGAGYETPLAFRVAVAGFDAATALAGLALVLLVADRFSDFWTRLRLALSALYSVTAVASGLVLAHWNLVGAI